MMQRILIMSTRRPDLRSKAEGWTCEDGERVLDARGGAGMAHDDIGRVRWAHGFYSYEAPLLAIGDGWALLAPPNEEGDGTWTWWFTKGPTPISDPQEGR